jgi:hypothetical protein
MAKWQTDDVSSTEVHDRLLTDFPSMSAPRGGIHFVRPRLPGEPVGMIDNAGVIRPPTRWRDPWRRRPVRIVQLLPCVVDLDSDEAAALWKAKRCACGHLDIFHGHDEDGDTCTLCDCEDVRTALTSSGRSS